MSTRRIDSVGIDVGTTTTQVIFSALELTNRAPASQVPRYEFSKREITYLSPVVFTPVDHAGHIDAAALAAFVDAQYAAAGLTRAQVESGAIIITGETSKARNARQTVMELAETLGDFVVATAGPHLEAIIAGHGSGAGEYSQANSARVLNIDIGGGTANYVVFDCGRVDDTACLNVGGHLLETDGAGRVLFAHEPGRRIVGELFGNADPAALTRAQLEAVAERMAALIVEVAEGRPSELARALLMTDCLRSGHAYDAIYLSGGVGECYYRPPSAADTFAWGDLGPLFAVALHRHPGLAALPVRVPRQTLRATVIGAGAYTLSLSGSTIWLNYERLPIRNVPVMHPSLAAQDAEPAQLATAWEVSARRMDIDPGGDLYALAIPPALPVSYRSVLGCADALREFSGRHPNPAHPLIVVSRQDFGKALGMELQPHLRERELAVIDEVETREGDYVDIGRSYFGGGIVPLTIKSLAFPS
ncbi:ethanolamine ammonia-lyase reactivating factor EutA [Pseudothauera rhizosphaerae]|uniref:Ethanolamine utilization protein EutA n=1 Tax=Pseudothauera rhizosphaerae TaxID=2565932 RepID=A0A4S4ALY4_9RHOO|nr:ethanolamine ammonia-lyase reactivating factor EutA [Pseudothauera rhizosphaerae]THF59310.1 ethanolamine utilization protein EutA [Pseudothauera rhizosphaerae]